MNFIQAICTLSEREGKFHVRLKFDNGGMWFVSEETFSTQEEAEKAMYHFMSSNGVQVVTVSGTA